MGLPGGKRRKETLHSKASESAAHVAGFGLHLEGCGPPNLPDGFFDSLRTVRCTVLFHGTKALRLMRAKRSAGPGGGEQGSEGKRRPSGPIAPKGQSDPDEAAETSGGRGSA